MDPSIEHPDGKTRLIRYGSYAACLLVIGALLNNLYEVNAWASDLEDIKIEQGRQLLGLEKRALTRQIMQWETKPVQTESEKNYKRVIVDQLKSDKEDVRVKLRGLK